MVEVTEVRKVYRQGDVEVPALSGVSLSIDPGAFLALAGPSGSGKTTLLNLIGGLDVPDGGQITVDGLDLGTLSATTLTELRLHRIGFVFQAYNLIPVLTAVENTEYVMLLQGVPKKERRERSMAILDEVGLSGLYHRKPSELSGGQQQRVAVARAVVSGPAIVLADEPTANLDSATGEGLLAMMREMNEARGVTFVFSTHDAMVMGAARKVVRMKDGRLDGDRAL